MTPNEKELWRERAALMTRRLAPDLPDEDWQGAMRVLGHIGPVAGLPVLTAIAKAAHGTTRDAAQGLAVRKRACQQFGAVLFRPGGASAPSA